MEERAVPSEPNPHRVVLVEPQPIFLEGLIRVVDLAAGLEVAGAAGTRREAEALGAKGDFHLLVTATEIGMDDGLGLISWLRQTRPHIACLALIGGDPVRMGDRALRAGASAYVARSASPRDLILSMREVIARHGTTERVVHGAEGMRWHARGLEPNLLLSRRELEIFRAFGEGLAPREIAIKLGLSLKTVGSHRSNIQARLGLNGASDLLKQAVAWVEDQKG